MSNDYITKTVMYFCEKNNVDFMCCDSADDMSVKCVMRDRETKKKAIRYIDWGSLPHLLISALLNEMYKEICK